MWTLLSAVPRKAVKLNHSLNLTPGFNGLGKDNCKTRQETFKFWKLVPLMLEVWQYFKMLPWGYRWEIWCLGTTPLIGHFCDVLTHWGRHKNTPIPHLYGWAMGCILWVLWRKVTVKYLECTVPAHMRNKCIKTYIICIVSYPWWWNPLKTFFTELVLSEDTKRPSKKNNHLTKLYIEWLSHGSLNGIWNK